MLRDLLPTGRMPQNSDHCWLLDIPGGKGAGDGLPADSGQAVAHHLCDGEADAGCGRPQHCIWPREPGVCGIERSRGSCVRADGPIGRPYELPGKQPAQHAGDGWRQPSTSARARSCRAPVPWTHPESTFAWPDWPRSVGDLGAGGGNRAAGFVGRPPHRCEVTYDPGTADDPRWRDRSWNGPTQPVDHDYEYPRR